MNKMDAKHRGDGSLLSLRASIGDLAKNISELQTQLAVVSVEHRIEVERITASDVTAGAPDASCSPINRELRELNREVRRLIGATTTMISLLDIPSLEAS